jgi:hypothetical protein
MYITHSYVGTLIGDMRYLFFTLYEDYNDLQRSFVQELNVLLSRFARNLMDHGAVIMPFDADIEDARSHVLAKDWTDAEHEEVTKVPSLLVISKDFDDFSPRRDPWMIFHFGERRFGGHEGLADLNDILREIADVAAGGTGANKDLYEMARDFAREEGTAVKAFSAQPGIFGFSIDVVEAGRRLREWIRNRQRRIGRP